MAFKYLSYRERSRHEMEDYLARKGFSQSVAEQTVRYLKNLDYINDRRFALAWGKNRIDTRQVGKYRLQQELLGKGISEEDVDRALATLYSDVDELQLAQTCVEKKLRTFQRVGAETQRRRIAQFLQRKGFPGHVIAGILERTPLSKLG